MSLVQLDGVTKYFGDQLVFDRIAAAVERGDKIGLVGPNGVGKTTVLRIIAEEILPDSGSVRKASQCRIGYLPQRPERTWDMTLRHLLMTELSEIRRLAEALGRLEREMAFPEVYQDPRLLEQVMIRYGQLQEEFRLAGGYSYEVKMKQVLRGLGFSEEHLDRPVAEFSGGEAVRAELARLLLTEPDLLLLDEPTNHLDMQATEWLEGYLRELKKAVILVSHDRYFLDSICNRIWELDNHQLLQYKGNFTRYAALRQERLSRQEAEYQAFVEEAQRLQAYIDRYRAGNRARQAQSREKRLAKLKAVSRPTATAAVNLKLAFDANSVKQVLLVEEMAIGYDKPLVRNLNLTVLRGERWGIIGPNGVGKSTLLKVLVEEESPLAGSFAWGDGVAIGYFRQGLDDMQEDNTILDEVLEARNLPVGEMRSFLARFLFTGDQVFRKIGTLSGGERCRVALAKLILQRPNVLLLDEPTNHLDVVSREALERALADFQGTMLLVTHDRYLLDKLVTHLLVLEPEGYEVFEGNYTAYREHKRQEREAAAAALETEAPARTRRQPVKEAKRDLARDLACVEEAITAAEQELQKLAEEMADPDVYTDGEAIRALSLRHREVSQGLEELYHRWEELLLELEQESNGV
ncbi:MAG TPA: ABC-F family ATP-binding cassette domain-containing protein [Firmicutes bacterium]|nr:ABC-F family ATP-binding cassette domain-containing protein [Bacillota bacterium]